MDWVLSVVTIFLALPFPGRCSHVYSRSDFPDGFAFGSGTSAYQWEGAADEDGRTPSVWETFVDSRNLESGGIACDGYHKYKEDVQLMVETGLDAFKISISWSRLIPNGRGPVNPKGLQFYKSFIQELVTNGIEPHVTLFHYDHPQALEDDYGGWLNRTIIKDFTAYADVCFREFGNHVKFWTTINEGNIYTIGGYNDGIAPPGRCSRNYCLSGNSSTEPYIVGHNLLLAHASASRLYRQKYKDMQGGSVGFSLYAIGFSPSTSSKDDEMAAQRARDFFLGWMLGPLVFGDYPYVMRRAIGSRLPHFSEEESELVKGSSDFVGIIHYLAATVTNIKPHNLGYPEFYSDTGVTLTYLCNVSSSGCAPTPWAMEDVLEYIKQSYGNPPVYILENGHAIKGDLQLQQKDTQRIEYLHVYIGAVLKAVKNGSDTRGYFVWSYWKSHIGENKIPWVVYMKCFFGCDGYDSSYGLYYVNFSDPHRKRSPKLSAHWYSAFLKGDTTSLDSQGIAQLPTPGRPSGSGIHVPRECILGIQAVHIVSHSRR